MSSSKARISYLWGPYRQTIQRNIVCVKISSNFDKTAGEDAFYSNCRQNDSQNRITTYVDWQMKYNDRPTSTETEVANKRSMTLAIFQGH